MIRSAEMDVDKHEFWINNQLIHLPRKEWDLLEILIRNKNKVYSRDELLKAIWPATAYAEIDTRTVDQHIARLREKIYKIGIKDPHALIKTITGYGYRATVGTITKRSQTLDPKELGDFVLARLPYPAVEALSSVPQEARNHFYGRLQVDLEEVVSDAVRELTATE